MQRAGQSSRWCTAARAAIVGFDRGEQARVIKRINRRGVERKYFSLLHPPPPANISGAIFRQSSRGASASRPSYIRSYTAPAPISPQSDKQCEKKEKERKKRMSLSLRGDEFLSTVGSTKNAHSNRHRWRSQQRYPPRHAEERSR